MRGTIERQSLLIQKSNLLAVLQKRTITGRRGTTAQRLFQAYVQIHHRGGMVADNLPDCFLHEGTATQSDSGRLVSERFEKLPEELRIELAKSRLTPLNKT